MEKVKLLEMRKFKGFSQKQIADKLNMSVSNYNRYEKGHLPLDEPQWNKLAKILDVPLNEIIEFDDKQVIICNDHASASYQGTHNSYNIPKSFIETQQKYIAKLEEENIALKRLLENK